MDQPYTTQEQTTTGTYNYYDWIDPNVSESLKRAMIDIDDYQDHQRSVLHDTLVFQLGIPEDVLNYSGDIVCRAARGSPLVGVFPLATLALHQLVASFPIVADWIADWNLLSRPRHLTIYFSLAFEDDDPHS